MKIEVGVTERGMDRLQFLSKTVWAAYYRQHIAGDAAGKDTGSSFFVGLASAFEHIQYETGAFEDWIGRCMCSVLLSSSLRFIRRAISA